MLRSSCVFLCTHKTLKPAPAVRNADPSGQTLQASRQQRDHKQDVLQTARKHDVLLYTEIDCAINTMVRASLHEHLQYQDHSRRYTKH